jgi:hypothetical protein
MPAVVVTVAIMATGCGASGNVVARVAGARILDPALHHWESVAAEVQQETASEHEAPAGRALSFLILASWLEGEARRQHVQVSNGQAKEQLEVLSWDQREHLKYERLPRDPQLKLYLTSPKVPSSDRLWLMKLAMILSRLEEQRRTRALSEITPQQIARFYRGHQKQFWRPERRDLEVIGNSKLSVVIKAKREVEAGGDFLRIAKRVSTDQEAPGGLEHPLARGEEEPEYDRVVFSAKPHTLVGPVEQTFYFIFEVIRVRPAHEESLARATKAIRRQLAWQRASSLLRARFEQAWIARTTCQGGYASVRCRSGEVRQT